jgi:hypothetical protein
MVEMVTKMRQVPVGNHAALGFFYDFVLVPTHNGEWRYHEIAMSTCFMTFQ